MYDSIVRYGLYGEICELPPHLRGYFTLIKPSMDSSRKRYDAAQRNGERGGRPKKNQSKNQLKNQLKNQTRNQRQNQDIDLDKDLDKDSDKDKESPLADKPHKSRFIPPTVEEVAEYCRERGNGVDAQTFVDH